MNKKQYSQATKKKKEKSHTHTPSNFYKNSGISLFRNSVAFWVINDALWEILRHFLQTHEKYNMVSVYRICVDFSLIFQLKLTFLLVY